MEKMIYMRKSVSGSSRAFYELLIIIIVASALRSAVVNERIIGQSSNSLFIGALTIGVITLATMTSNAMRGQGRLTVRHMWQVAARILLVSGFLSFVAWLPARVQAILLLLALVMLLYTALFLDRGKPFLLISEQGLGGTGVKHVASREGVVMWREITHIEHALDPFLGNTHTLHVYTRRKTIYGSLRSIFVWFLGYPLNRLEIPISQLDEPQEVVSSNVLTVFKKKGSPKLS